MCSIKLNYALLIASIEDHDAAKRRGYIRTRRSKQKVWWEGERAAHTVSDPRQQQHLWCPWSKLLTPPAPVKLISGSLVRLWSHWAAPRCDCVRVIIRPFL